MNNIVYKIVNNLKKKKKLIIWNNIKRKDENIDYVPDLKKTKKLLKWKPTISLEVGVKKMEKYL